MNSQKEEERVVTIGDFSKITDDTDYIDKEYEGQENGFTLGIRDKIDELKKMGMVTLSKLQETADYLKEHYERDELLDAAKSVAVKQDERATSIINYALYKDDIVALSKAALQSNEFGRPSTYLATVKSVTDGRSSEDLLRLADVIDHSQGVGEFQNMMDMVVSPEEWLAAKDTELLTVNMLTLSAIAINNSPEVYEIASDLLQTAKEHYDARVKEKAINYEFNQEFDGIDDKVFAKDYADSHGYVDDGDYEEYDDYDDYYEEETPEDCGDRYDDCREWRYCGHDDNGEEVYEYE